MTLKAMVSELNKTRGLDIKIYHRPDGSIRVRSINGVHYSGSEGNDIVRAMIGQALPSHLETQLRSKAFKTEKGQWGHIWKYETRTVEGKAIRVKRHMEKKIFPEQEDLKALRKAQRAFRKAEKAKKAKAEKVGGKYEPTLGKPTKRKLAYNIAKHGRKEAMRRLESAVRYAQGLANYENIETLIQRIRTDLEKKRSEDMRDFLSFVENNRETFRESWIGAIYDTLYDWERGYINGSTCAARCFAICGR